MVCVNDFINGRMAWPNGLEAETSNGPKFRVGSEQLLGLVGGER